MSHLSWVDHRTLLACRLLITAAYAFIFMGKRIMYPTLRGPGSISLGFLSGFVGSLLILGRGTLPLFVSMVIGNIFIFAGFALLYRGILQFFGDVRKVNSIWWLLPIPTLLMAFFSTVVPSLTYQIVISGITVGVIRALIAIELFRQPAPRRMFLRVFAFFMAAYAVFGFLRAFATLRQGAPADIMANGGEQTSALVISTLFATFLGPFVMLMLSRELTLFFEDQAQQDTLLSILNRRGLELKLVPELERTAQPLSVALMDLDNFKIINDTEGHAAGDDALRKVARTIAPLLRETDFFGRYGGDEFLLALPNTTYSDALLVAERIRLAIDALPLTEFSSPLTVSIGLTQSEPYETREALLVRADAALYEAKHAGRNCSRVLLSRRHTSKPFGAENLTPIT